MGGFDLNAARAIAGGEELRRHQVLDLLTLLIDKSLVVAENAGGRTPYRLMETVRQYALEKLGESGEANDVRDRHRDHYTALAAVLEEPASVGHQVRIEPIEDHFVSGMRRFWGIGTGLMLQGELTAAAAQFRALVAEAEAAHDPLGQVAVQSHLGHTLAYVGDTIGARAAATAAAASAEFGGFLEGVGYAPLAREALAAGDVAAATEAGEVARQRLSAHPVPGGNVNPIAEIALARGDLVAARRYADEIVSIARGIHLALALIARARVAIAQGQPEQAERDAHKALACAVAVDVNTAIPDFFECLAVLASDAESYREAARLFGAADTLRQRTGVVRYTVYDADYDASVAAVRAALGDSDFESAWAEGAALSTDEAIAYAQRGRGERKRPSSGWASLTPAERDVVRSTCCPARLGSTPAATGPTPAPAITFSSRPAAFTPSATSPGSRPRC
jgi:tetratricopeptide (TPR) repeat protein